MNSNDANVQKTVREYLLGRLTPEDSSHVEERLLTDDNFYQELLAGEDDLIDEYLSGELSASERNPFEDYFTRTPERHEKLRFARTLKRYITNNEPANTFESAALEISSAGKAESGSLRRKRSGLWFLPWGNPIISYSVAAAVVVIFALVSVFIIRNLTNRGPSGPGRVWAVELTPGRSRGEGEFKQITIPNGTDTVQFELKTAAADGYRSYRAILQTPDGQELFKREALRSTLTANSATLSFQVPADLLSRTDYSVKLSGLNQRDEYDDIGRYSFRVVR
ncbi:MAG TPA: hypothetical protein DC054_04360 [Blastocatellia bacterium]|nr:hypothetical protein [Blastocatellia bacterium]